MRPSPGVRLAVVGLLLVALMGGVAGEYYDWRETDSNEILSSKTFDLTSKTSNMYVNNISFFTREPNTYTVEILDSNSNVVASKSRTFDNSYLEPVFDFSQSDYSSFIEDGESFSISISGGNVNYVDSPKFVSYDGTLFSFSDQQTPWQSGDVGLSIKKANKPPQFNSSNVSPDPPLFGENVSYGVEASDPDGNVSELNLTVFKDGSQVFHDSVSGQASYNWSDVYVPQSDGELDARFRATDDAGATSTEWLNRSLTDEAPDVSIQSPGNQTYFKYEVPLEFSVSDSDSEPGEDWSCSVERDGSVVENYYLKEGVNSSVSSTVRSDLGGHNVSVACTDGSGNTGQASENYHVKAFQFSDSSSQASVFETENIYYDSDFKTGAMVESVDLDLSWNGSVANSTTIQASESVQTLSETLYHTIPLSYIDGEDVEWRFEASINYEAFNGSSSSMMYDSSLNSQTVDWAYSLEDSYTEPESGRYIEGEDIQHFLEISKETEKASITGETKYWRNGDTVEASLNLSNSSISQFKGVIGSGRADSFNNSQFQVSSTATVSFQDRERTIQSPNSTVDLYRTKLTKCDTSLNTAEALVFDTDYETEDKDVETDVYMDLNLYKTENVERLISLRSYAKKEHSFCIYPSWANYTMDTDGERIVYQQTHDEKRRRSKFFPMPQSLSNQTTNVPLLVINQSQSIEVPYEIYDDNGQGEPGVVCDVNRDFPGLGKYQTVASFRSGANGETRTYLEVNEIEYSHVCYKDGEAISTFEDQVINLPMRLDLEGDEITDVLNYDQNFDASCSVGSDNISCEYQSRDEGLNYAELVVERQEVVKDEVVCSKKVGTLTGGMTCDGLNMSNRYRYSVTADFNTGDYLAIRDFAGDIQTVFGSVGIVATLFLMLVTFATTMWRVLPGILLGTGSILVTDAIGWMPLPPVVRASLFSLVVIIAGVLARK